MGITDAVDVNGRGVQLSSGWDGKGGLQTSARLLKGVSLPWLGPVAVEAAAEHVKVMSIPCTPQCSQPRGCPQQRGRAGDTLPWAGKGKEQGGAWL